MKKDKAILGALISLFVVGSTAQESMYEEMVTDRPDQTESSSLVPKDFLQVETGMFFESNEDLEIHGFNTTLFRYGLLENLELRLGSEFYEIKQEFPEGKEIVREAGFAPLLVGAKIGITEEKGLLPEMGLLLHLYLPFTVKEEYRPETTAFDFRFAFSHNVSKNTDLSYNFGAGWGPEVGDVTYFYTLAYGISISRKLGIFGEVYGDLPPMGAAKHFWDAGLTFSLMTNLQLDAYAGTGINSPQDLAAGAGISYRFPH